MSSQLPRLEDCDPDNPDEALVWACMNIPVAGQSPMVFPRMIAEKLSNHFSACGIVHAPSLARLANEHGFIHVDQLPKQSKKYLRPYRGEQHPLNPAGGWVDMDAEEPEPIVIQDPAQMTERERAAQIEQYRYLGYRVNEPVPEPEKAQVVDRLDLPPHFDPGMHSVAEVNTYLRGVDDELEYGRVVRAEARGRARAGILKRHNERGPE